MADAIDLSRWPNIDPAETERKQPDEAARRLLANVDIRKEGFHSTPHLIWEWHEDGSVTVGYPWSEFRFTVEPIDGEHHDDCVRRVKFAFNKAYDDVLRSSKEESDALGRVMREAGIVPLSERGQ